MTDDLLSMFAAGVLCGLIVGAILMAAAFIYDERMRPKR